MLYFLTREQHSYFGEIGSEKFKSGYCNWTTVMFFVLGWYRKTMHILIRDCPLLLQSAFQQSLSTLHPLHFTCSVLFFAVVFFFSPLACGAPIFLLRFPLTLHSASLSLELNWNLIFSLKFSHNPFQSLKVSFFYTRLHLWIRDQLFFFSSQKIISWGEIHII